MFKKIILKFLLIKRFLFSPTMTLSWFKIKALGKIAFYVLIVFFPIIVNCTETEPNIRTVYLYKSGWQLSYPILNLQKPDEKLVLSFDDL